jgi:hypothetical protein
METPKSDQGEEVIVDARIILADISVDFSSQSLVVEIWQP